MAFVVPSWSVLLFALVLFVAAASYLALRHPDLLVRIVLWLPARALYRIRVFGRDNIPATGPLLYVCNHVSFIDAFFVFLAQKHKVRFLFWAPYSRVPLVGKLLKFSGGIPIDGTAGPRSIVQSLRAASEALSRGDIVCIFAEGGITRTGFLLPFNRGLEQILKRCPAPVVPVCLDHVWGSIFSHQGGRFFWKWPQTLPYPVTIAFGPPMPATSTAVEVRQAIQLLSAECAIARTADRRPVHRQFIRMAVRHPFRIGIVDAVTQQTLNYGKVLAGARVMSRHLQKILTGEDKVGLWLPPGAGGALANIALAMMGKVSVNLNYTSSAEGVRSSIAQCRIKHVLTARMFVHKVPLDPDAGVELFYLDDLRQVITTFERLRAYLAVILLPRFFLERFVYKTHQHRCEDLATIIFSSGSTGDPKGVMLTHGNLAANIESTVQGIDPGPRDILFGILPLFHSFGYTVTLWVPLQVGASLLYYPDPRASKEIGELCRKHKATIFIITPTLLRFCLRRCHPDDFKSVRILMVGAEKLPQTLADEFQEKFGVRPIEGYGCTECAPVVSANVPDWEEGGLHQIGNKSGTIGQPLPGIAVRIVDQDTFVPLPPNTEGMLLVRGGNVMAGYLDRPAETAIVMRDGWYITGDLAKYDEEGFITITDRVSRFSKVAGEMVPHQKIEDELHAILHTNERVCVVTAVPDERKGERLLVLHTPLNGVNPHHLWEQLGTRGMPNLWIPAERDFLQIPEVPLLGTGKVDLKRARQIAVERLSQSAG